MIRFRELLIAGGSEDASDCGALRDDPAFKMAVGRLPETGARTLLAADHVAAGDLPGPTALKRMMARLADLLAGCALPIGSIAC